jgi:hypothetical protein
MTTCVKWVIFVKDVITEVFECRCTPEPFHYLLDCINHTSSCFGHNSNTDRYLSVSCLLSLSVRRIETDLLYHEMTFTYISVFKSLFLVLSLVFRSCVPFLPCSFLVPTGVCILYSFMSVSCLSILLSLRESPETIELI